MEWKKVEGYEHYMISNLGVVMTTAKCKNKELGQRMWGEYLAVKLSKNNIGKRWAVHRLLAIHFIPNPDNKMYVDHINRDKTDNRLENLRWVSFGENICNRNVLKSSRLQVKYIAPRGKSFRVTLRWLKIYRDFKTLELAVAWRNEYLGQNNMNDRL